MDNYLQIEPLIITRLKDQIADVTIKSTWWMPKIQEHVDLPPAVLLVLEDDIPGEINLSRGAAQKINQTWTCIVLSNNAEHEAGPLISQVIKAMNGWQSSEAAFSPFKRIKTGFKPESSPNGVYYFPLAFSTSFVFTV